MSPFCPNSKQGPRASQCIPVLIQDHSNSLQCSLYPHSTDFTSCCHTDLLRTQVNHAHDLWSPVPNIKIVSTTGLPVPSLFFPRLFSHCFSMRPPSGRCFPHANLSLRCWLEHLPSLSSPTMQTLLPSGILYRFYQLSDTFARHSSHQ